MRTWLKAVREGKNLSQKELVDLIGISSRFYSYIEAGKRRPSPEKAKSIAKTLDFENFGLDWTKFFEEEAVEPP